jgi:hypothetical protein
MKRFQVLRLTTVLLIAATSAVHAEGFLNEQRLDSLHSDISDGIERTATWLDAFFVDPVFEEEQNNSQLKLRFDGFAEKGESIDFRPRVSARVRLPGTQKRFNFFISGNGDDPDLDASDPRAGEEDENSGIGLNYFVFNEVRNSLSLSGGVKRRDGSYGLFVQPRYRKLWRLGDWDTRYTQKVAYHSKTRFETESRVDFERLIGQRSFFRSTARLEWFEYEPGFQYSLDLLLREILDEDSVLSFEFNNFFVTRPEHELDTSVLKASYRRRFWRDWMFYEIAPQLAFPSEDDYEAKPGILLRFEAVFGRLDNAL